MKPRLGSRRAVAVAARASSGASGRIDTGGFQAAARPAGFFRRTHGHHKGLGFLQLLIGEGRPQPLLQLSLDLAMADPAAVLGDQGDQGRR